MNAYMKIKMKIFAMMCADLEAEFHGLLSTTSGLRTKARNSRVGGAPTSKHLEGLARDYVLDSPSNKASFMERVKRMGLLAIDEGDHIHVQVPKGQ